MRTSLSVALLALLAAAAPAAAQPTVRSAVRDVTLPRVDSANSRNLQQAQQLQQAQGQQQAGQQQQQAGQPPQGQATPQEPTVHTGPLAPTPPPPAGQSGEPQLVFEREVFNYPGRSRRDPFRPLTNEVGPLFEDLKINIILYSTNPAESVVLLSDDRNKVYRLRRGDTVGNSTVVDIGPTRVVFSVVDFGIRRQEVLAMRAQREGA